jgi:hypothetical protein
MKNRNRFIAATAFQPWSSVAPCAGIRFQLSLRDVEELLFECGVIVTYAPKEVP